MLRNAALERGCRQVRQCTCYVTRVCTHFKSRVRKYSCGRETHKRPHSHAGGSFSPSLSIWTLGAEIYTKWLPRQPKRRGRREGRLSALASSAWRESTAPTACRRPAHLSGRYPDHRRIGPPRTAFLSLFFREERSMPLPAGRLSA